MSLVIRNAEVAGDLTDVRITDTTISAVGREVTVWPSDDVVDARGGALIPGLHDHHIHLLALAAAEASVALGPPDVRDRVGFVEALRRAERHARAGQWIRGVGYHDRVAGSLDRWVLDTVVADVPLRVQHRSGALWVLNSAAVRSTGLDAASDVEGVETDSEGLVTGRLWRLDDWLRDRVSDRTSLDLRSSGDQLLRHGVTGVTDATPTNDSESLRLLGDAVDRGDLRQRVVVMGGPALRWDDTTNLEQGPMKFLFPDHRPLTLDEVEAAIRAARAAGRAVAVHAVTSATAALTVAALEEIGVAPGDRLEHGAILPLGLAARLAEMGVTVVTNPGFILTRGDDYLDEVEPGDLDDLWRCRSLLDAGVAVGAGTDAPHGDPNPWAAIAAATRRRTSSGAVLGSNEAVTARRALELFLSPANDPGGPPRRVRAGQRADLCLLACSLGDALKDPRGVRPIATVVAGHLAHA